MFNKNWIAVYSGNTIIFRFKFWNVDLKKNSQGSGQNCMLGF